MATTRELRRRSIILMAIPLTRMLNTFYVCLTGTPTAKQSGERSKVSEQDGVQIAALGPLRFRHQAGWQEIRSPMERALLALLVVRGGQLATQDWLIINLWPERVPREAKSVLQNYVSNLSSALEPTRRPGRP